MEKNVCCREKGPAEEGLILFEDHHIGNTLSLYKTDTNDISFREVWNARSNL